MKEFSNTGVYLSSGSACAKALAEGNVKLASQIFSQTSVDFKKLIPSRYDRAWLMAKSKGEDPPASPPPLVLGSLRADVEQLRLLAYMLYCNRVPYDCWLPLPPPPQTDAFIEPGSDAEKAEIAQLLYQIREHYCLMAFKLADDQSTNAERERVRQHTVFKQLHWYMPEHTWKDVVKMKVPEGMDHQDYIFLIKNCEGHTSQDRKHLMFVGHENMKRFEQYFTNKQRGNA
jgi:hypothetical protein